ncbi:zeta toxin family protein, partial [Streptomyces sp. NPDC058612]|uniref:zeta toxin family protein n=1 Tax=Streptomyces sp. NPDC058612 TaxID=3346555 RepID=UPI003665B9C5
SCSRVMCTGLPDPTSRRRQIRQTDHDSIQALGGDRVGGTDVGSVLLSGLESDHILQQAILPAATKDADRQDQPVVVIVGGQPGAGKTWVSDLVQAALDRRGGAVRIGRDLYKASDRRYAEFLAEDVRAAGVKVRPDTSRWQAGLEDHVRERGFDAVVESALADPAEFRTSATAYRGAGHRVEIVAVATAEAWSQLGVLDRFLSEAIDGGGPVRVVGEPRHVRPADARDAGGD